MNKVCLVCVGLMIAVEANAFIVFDPSNFAKNTFIAQESHMQVLNQARQIQQEIQSLNYQLKNTGSLSSFQWQNLESLMQRYDQITSQGNALSYSTKNVDAAYKNTFENYNTVGALPSYANASQKWHQSTLDTLRGSIDAAANSAQNLKSESAQVSALESNNKGVTGRLQALQVGNQLSAEAFNQLQSIKRDLMEQQSVQSNYLSYKVSQDSLLDKNLSLVSDSLSEKAHKAAAGFSNIQAEP